MQRDAMQRLIEWQTKKNRKPLVLRGARQTGKTWLLDNFGQEYFDDVVKIEFDNNKRVQVAWEPDLDPHRIIQELEILTQSRITPDKTLLIFDEIQDFPKALTSLKYFCERAPEYHVACAGSYLGIALHEGTSFPVGKVEFVDLHPLSYTEYLQAIKADNLLEHLAVANFDRLHLLAIEYTKALRDYFYLGGMPEVVQAFIDSGDYSQARTIQQSIIDAYDHDFSKHAPAIQVPRIRALWNSIPEQLGKENRRFVYGDIAKSARAREFETAMAWILDTGIAYKLSRISDVRVPLKPYTDEKAFKLYLSDVGLLSCMGGLDRATLEDNPALFVEFKGALAEQYVLQQLLAQTAYYPYYWVNAAGRAEVDFVIQANGLVYPIEVKSGEHLQAKALKVYRDKYHPTQAIRFSLGQPYRGEEIVDIPLYAISLLPQIVSEL